MTPQILIVLGIVGAATALLVSDRVRADLVALMVLVALGLTGLVPGEVLFSGFGRGAVITILSIFILTAGLEQAGVGQAIGERLARASGHNPVRLTVLVMAAGAGLSLVMNNIAAGAVLLPAVMSTARQTRLKPSKLLIPLAFSTLLGGMATLLTTSNILVSGVLRDHGLRPFGLFDFASVGLPIVLAGILFMVTVGRRLLPNRDPANQMARLQPTGPELERLYGLRENVIEVYVMPGSTVANLSLADGHWGERLGLTVIGIDRGGQFTLAPHPQDLVREGDVIAARGHADETLLGAHGLRPTALSSWRGAFEAGSIRLVEVVLAPRSRYVNFNLRQIRFREKFGVNALAIWREGKALQRDVADEPLRLGDALLVQGPDSKIDLLRSEQDFLVLDGMPSEKPLDRRRALRAVAIMAAALGVATAGWLPIAEATFAGALAMVLAGCLNMDEAYRAVEWRAIFLIAGLLPLGIAMTQTGTADWLASGVVAGLGRLGPVSLALGLFLLATLLVQVMGNVATAVILAPIAISAAASLGTDPRAMAMAVALGASMAFLTPTGHPVNILMMGPGGYNVRDYLKVGLPLTLLLSIVVAVFLPILWGIR